MKKLMILLLFPGLVLAQNYLVPNTNYAAAFVKAKIVNDTIKIEAEKPITAAEVFRYENDTLEVSHYEKIIGYECEIPLHGIPVGRHVLNVMADRRMIIYTLIINP